MIGNLTSFTSERGKEGFQVLLIVSYEFSFNLNKHEPGEFDVSYLEMSAVRKNV